MSREGNEGGEGPSNLPSYPSHPSRDIFFSSETTVRTQNYGERISQVAESSPNVSCATRLPSTLVACSRVSLSLLQSFHHDDPPPIYRIHRTWSRRAADSVLDPRGGCTHQHRPYAGFREKETRRCRSQCGDETRLHLCRRSHRPLSPAVRDHARRSRA